MGKEAGRAIAGMAARAAVPRAVPLRRGPQVNPGTRVEGAPPVLLTSRMSPWVTSSLGLS